MTIGILHTLAEHGRRVPEDISLVSFDDIAFTQYTILPLTTVRQDHAATAGVWPLFVSFASSTSFVSGCLVLSFQGVCTSKQAAFTKVDGVP